MPLRLWLWGLAGDSPMHRVVDLVIGTDVDEFLIVDPMLGVSLAEYLSTAEVRGSLSALGLDVVRHLDM